MDQTFSSRQKKAIFLILIVGPFLAGVGIDLYVPSLPIIAEQFKVLQQYVQLTISVYLFGTALGQLSLGTVSDSIGRKKVLLASSIFYILFSLVCVLSPNVICLNIFRFFQGACLGGVLVSCRAIATDCFSGLRLNKAMTLFSISWGLGPIIGPFLGGYLEYYWHWQSNFYFFAASGALVLIISFFLPETHLERNRFNFSSTLKGLKFISSHPKFLFNILILAFLYSLLVIFNVVGPFLIQVVLKYSVVAYGHIALLLGVGYLLGSVLNRFLIHKFNPLRIALYGLIAAFICSLAMVFIDALKPITITSVIIPTFILFFLCGVNYPNITTKALSLFPKSSGIASALMGSIVTIGTFIISAFTSFLKTNTQLPTSLTYLGMMVLSLLFFLLFMPGTLKE